MRSFVILILASSASLAQSPAADTPPALSPDTVVIRVGGRSITRAEFESLAVGAKADVTGAALESRRISGDKVGSILALAEEARRRKIDQRPDVQGRIKYLTEQLLASVVFDSLLAEVNKEEAASRKSPETHQSVVEERQLRQILIRFKGTKTPLQAGRRDRSESEAKQKAESLLAKLKAGANFTELAKTESDDQSTASKGGDLGYRMRGGLVTEFAEVAFRMPAGQVSDPVKTEYGYHLILVEKIAPPKFEQVRKSVEYQIARERLDDLSRKGYELNPAYFGPPK